MNLCILRPPPPPPPTINYTDREHTWIEFLLSHLRLSFFVHPFWARQGRISSRTAGEMLFGRMGKGTISTTETHYLACPPSV